jgi:hypothetical protein
MLTTLTSGGNKPTFLTLDGANFEISPGCTGFVRLRASTGGADDLRVLLSVEEFERLRAEVERFGGERSSEEK